MEPRITSSLREAIVCRQWAEAEQLLLEFRSTVVAAWSQAVGEEERRELQAEVSTILDWVRVMTLSGRAQAHQKLIKTIRRGAYVEARSVYCNIQIVA